MRSRVSLFSSLFVLALATQARAELPVIEISGANFRPLPVAIAPPNASGVPRDAAADFDEALTFDLTAAGIFQVLDRKGFLSGPKEGFDKDSIRFARWADVGAQALVKTQLTHDGGSLKGELRLFTVGTGQEELRLTQTVPERSARRLAHGFADALFRHFTREPGAFRARIAFAKKSSSGKDVWLSDWDGRNAEPVATGGINLLPALGKDGLSVAFTSYRKGKPELWMQRGPGDPTPLVQNGQMATGISYSPDGKRIAYCLAQGDSAQIWVARADGSDARPITETPFFINSSPSWSPDGKRIAFVSNRGGSPQIYTMTADGKDPRRLTFQGNYNQTPDWSPRGDLIAFTARDERSAFDIFTVNVETGKLTRLTQGNGNNEEPSFSPNGRLITFTSNRTGTSQLFVMTQDGNNPLPLPTDKGAYYTPSWGPLPKE
jgi:TolB protein